MRGRSAASVVYRCGFVVECNVSPRVRGGRMSHRRANVSTRLLVILAIACATSPAAAGQSNTLKPADLIGVWDVTRTVTKSTCGDRVKVGDASVVKWHIRVSSGELKIQEVGADPSKPTELKGTIKSRSQTAEAKPSPGWRVADGATPSLVVNMGNGAGWAELVRGKGGRLIGAQLAVESVKGGLRAKLSNTGGDPHWDSTYFGGACLVEKRLAAQRK